MKIFINILILLVFASCTRTQDVVICDELPVQTKKNALILFAENNEIEYSEIKKAGNWIFANYTGSDSVVLLAVYNDSIVFETTFHGAGFEYYFLSKDMLRIDIGKNISQLLSNFPHFSSTYIFQLNSENKWILSFASVKETTEKEDSYQFDDNFEQEILLNHFRASAVNLSNTYVFNKKNSIEKISNQVKQFRSANTPSFKYIFTPEHAEELLRYYSVNISNVIYINNIAYYLEQMFIVMPAITMLENIISKYPSRAVCYLNLGDALFKAELIIKAEENYKQYTKLMKSRGKANEIPERLK